MADPAGGNTYAPGSPYSFKPLGYVQISVSGSPVTLGTIPPNATVALIAVSSNAVRWRDDLVSPNATTGMPVAVGQEFQYSGNLPLIEFIAETGSATLDVSFYQ